jgi:hypothetical protein
MQYQRILATCLTAICLAMMSTTFSSPTIPFYQQQEAYANHPCPPFAPIGAHIDGAPVGCFTEGDLDRRCTAGAPYDECSVTPEEICGNGIDDDGDGQVDENCPPPTSQPLNEKYPNQGTCIDAGENKDDCKAAFKADKPNK